MTLTLDSQLEVKLRARADAEGISVEAYVERLINADQAAEDELEALALEGLNSGPAVAGNQSYWAEKHRSLDLRLNRTGAQ